MSAAAFERVTHIFTASPSTRLSDIKEGCISKNKRRRKESVNKVKSLNMCSQRQKGSLEGIVPSNDTTRISELHGQTGKYVVRAEDLPRSSKLPCAQRPIKRTEFEKYT